MATPALFDVEADGPIRWTLALEAVEERGDGVVWLRYRVAYSPAPPAR